MREIDGVRTRCKECGGATSVVLRESHWDGEKAVLTGLWAEVVPHTRSDCQQMVTLMREQWPTLW